MNQTTATKSKPGRERHLVAHRLLAALLLLLTLWGQSAFAGVNALYGHYTTKPGRGVQVDWSHPLAQGLKLLEVFNSGVGTGGTNTTHTFGLDATGTRTGTMVESGIAATWIGNTAGMAFNMDSSAGNGYLHWGDSSFLPTTRVTVLYVRRKTDTTTRTASHFGVKDGSGTNIMQVQGPYNDGIVYWDFGGKAGANRISYTWVATTAVERFVFVAGTRGSAIYLNGVLQASQSTAITRTSTTNVLGINTGAVTTGDLQELGFFAVLDAEWNAAMAAAWSSDPYAFLLQSNVRRWGIPVTAGGGGGSGGLLLRGVGQ